MKDRRVLAAGLLLAALIAYLPALSNGWIWDDDRYVTENPTLRSVDGLRRIWTELDATPQYYPLVFTSFWLEARIFGLEPAGYHAVNLVLHALAALLAWRVLERLRVPGAWLAVALFAVHPIQVESVAWVTERKNVLSGVFYFAAAGSYLRFARPDPAAIQDGWRPYALAALFFLAALLSKTVTATLPAALLLVLAWRRGRLGRREILPALPLLLLGAGFGLLTAWLEHAHVGARGEEWSLSVIGRSLVAARALWFYAAKLAWPAELAFVYPRWTIDPGQPLQWVYLLGALTLALALWLARRRIGAGPLVALLYFAGTLAPALGFANVFPHRYSYVADHFQYLACIGPFAAAAGALARACDRLGTGPSLRAVSAGALVALLTALSWQQTGAYRDSEALWRDTLRKNPDAWMAHNNLGTILEARGELDEAAAHYRAALALRPRHANSLYNLAIVLARRGDHEGSLRQLRTALEIEPTHSEALVNVGEELVALGRVDEAVQHYRRALERVPDHALLHYNLAVHLLAAKDFDGALQHLREAERLAPRSVQVKTGLAWVLATHPDPTQRNPAEAIRLAERAVELSGSRDVAALDTLAVAYAASGRLDEALARAEAALQLARSVRDTWSADQIRARLESYRREQANRPTSRP